MADDAKIVAAPIFECIYCGHRGPKSDFDKEHVFSRSLCGSGENWTLVNRVCKSCNNCFSKFETELLQQAAESIARGFSGPLGRSSKNETGARLQPLKINHIYAQNANDNLVFEGGFSFPSEFYFRPQMIDVGDGTVLSFVSDRREIMPFQDAMTQFVRQPKRITLPRPPELNCRQRRRKDYEIVSFEEVGGHWRPTTREMNPEPSDVFFREFINRANFSVMTARLAQNDNGKLFFRAANLDAVGQFMDLLCANRQAAPRPPLPPGPRNQTFFFGLQIDLIKVYKAVLKTGLNLVAHFYGDEALQNGGFEKARRILLEDVPTNEAAAICQMSPDFTLDFPRANTDANQMMLDEFDGSLRFRMRLYNSFGYTAVLAPLNQALKTMFGSTLPKRVLVEYESVGMREVATWT
jgi:HNH endonuclease